MSAPSMPRSGPSRPPERVSRDIFAGARRTNLIRLIGVIDGLYRAGDEKAALEQIRREGADIGMRGGDNYLRLGGVTGTCTAGGLGLISSWLRLARKRVADTESVG